MNQNICLCYNTEKGFHTQNCYSCRDTIFTTYDTKGFKKTTIDMPTEGIKINIRSNFRFGIQSYLYAQIEYKDKLILDFSKDQIRVVNNSSVMKFCAPTEDWETLLKKIAIACKNATSDVCPTSAIGYVDELCKILNSDHVEIKRAFHDDTSSMRNGKFLTMLLVGDKLRDLFDGLDEAKMEDEVLTEHLLSLCRLFLCNLKSINIDFEDKRTIRIAQTLNYICKFLIVHDAEIEFLKFFNGSNS